MNDPFSGFVGVFILLARPSCFGSVESVPILIARGKMKRIGVRVYADDIGSVRC